MFIKKDYGDILRFLSKYKRNILWVAALNLISIICALIIPAILGGIFEALENKSATVNFLIDNFIKVVLIYIAWDITAGIREIAFEKVNKCIENDIRALCYEKIINANMVMVQGKSEGEIIAKVLRDSEKTEKAFSNLFSLAMSATRIVALMIAVTMANYILASVIVILFIIVVILQRYFTRPLKSLYGKYKDLEEKLLSDFKNQITGLLTIKVFSLENKSIDILRERNRDNLKAHMKGSKKASIIKNLNFFISSMFTVSTIFVGGFLHINQRLNLGQLFSINTYAIQLSFELRNIINTDIVLKDILLSFRRIMDFLIEFENCEGDYKEINGIYNIEFKNVNFSYGDKRVIFNFNLKADKNQIIGLKGNNGSGKTTLTYIICGFYKPCGVYINNIETKYLSEKNILRNVSYVLQSTFLFPCSIMDNLTCFGLVEEERVYDICKKLGIHEKIMSFSEGYETIVNEKNLNLSGGEKQLISLARALLKDSDVLILDEMNSAMDESVQEKLFNTLTPLFEDKIVFIISHRKKIFDMCNEIIDLDDYK